MLYLYVFAMFHAHERFVPQEDEHRTDNPSRTWLQSVKPWQKLGVTLHVSTGITFVFGHFLQKKACHKITTADHFWFLFLPCVLGGH